MRQNVSLKIDINSNFSHKLDIMVKKSHSKTSKSNNQIQLSTFLPIKANSQTLKRMTEVLSILSKNDALSIFLLARDNLKSELDTPYKIGLTKKQYYTRLKQLVDLGILTKSESGYTHTALGIIVYQKHILGLINNIMNSRSLEMIDVLRKASQFNMEEITSFISKIKGPIDMDFASSDITKTNTVTINSYNDMVTKVIQIIEFATSEILLISRFTNDVIINAMIKKANMGVSVKVLADMKLVQDFIENTNGKAFLEDKNKQERIDVVINPYYPSKVDRKYIDVPFCVLVVDNKHVGMEIIDCYNPSKFNMAVFTQDTTLANRMKELFDKMWLKANKNPPQIATKT